MQGGPGHSWPHESLRGDTQTDVTGGSIDDWFSQPLQSLPTDAVRGGSRGNYSFSPAWNGSHGKKGSECLIGSTGSRVEDSGALDNGINVRSSFLHRKPLVQEDLGVIT